MRLVSDKDNLALIRSINFWLPSLRKLLKIDQENPKTQQVLQKLFKIRKSNLDKPDLIDIDFVQEIQDAIARAHNSEMTSEQKKKIKTQLARHVYYGLLPGQSKMTKKPKTMVIGEVKKKGTPYQVFIKNVFIRSFPHIWTVIEDVKRFNYKELAKELQGREANVFVDHILRDLLVKEKRPHFLSLHDPIYAQKVIETVKERIAQEFQVWGLQVPLNIDNITTGETEKIILNRQGDVFKQRFIKVRQNGEIINMYHKAS